MKNLFVLLIAIVTLIACKKENVGDYNFEIESNSVELSSIAQTKTIALTTNITKFSDIVITVDNEAKSWCRAQIANNVLEIISTQNTNLTPRTAVLTLTAYGISTNVDVKQLAENFEIVTDIKLTVESATASSQQTGEGIEKSYDGNKNTIWHTSWSVKNPTYTAIYYLKPAEVLDYIMYYPRMDGYNGYFGVIDVYVSTEASPDNFVLTIPNYDCKQNGDPKKIVFTTPIQKPKAVKFIIKSGYGDFASCAEMEFYQNQKGEVAKHIEIPMNKAGYVEPDLYANNVGSTMRLPYSETTKIQGKIFFKFGRTGNARIELKISNTTANKKIKFAFNNTIVKEVDVPVTSGAEWLTITTEKIQSEPNYSQVVIENLNAGDVYIESLRIVGDVSDDVSYNNNPEAPRRNAVSVHLSYNTANVSNIEWFYNEMTIPQGFDKPYHSYYMANGWNLGYSGLQTRDMSGANSARWLIFSCWNSKETDDINYWAKVTKKGQNVVSTSFGGEGTGAKTYIELDWKAEKTYCFLLQARVSAVTQNAATDTTFYSLFWKEKGAATWNFQATIMSPYNGKYYSGLYSFVENYIGIDGQYQRKALYTNQWVKNANGWSQINQATFSSDNTSKYRTDIGAGAESNGFFLWNGGFLPNSSWPGNSFTRSSSTTGQPVSDAELLQLAKQSR